MCHLLPLPPRKAEKVLNLLGWELIRQSGSNTIYKHSLSNFFDDFSKMNDSTFPRNPITFIRLTYFISLKASKTDFLSGSHNQDIFILKFVIILEVTHASSEKVDLAVGQ